MTAQNSELLPEYRVIFLWDDDSARDKGDNKTLSWMTETMRLTDKDLLSRLVRDEKNPQYIIATDCCLTSAKPRKALRNYLINSPESVFIFFTYEACEPDLNVVDYAFTWNPDLKCGDRIAQNFPYMYDFRNGIIYNNDLTREGARRLLNDAHSFCIFMYSHPSEPRDSMFHLLSKYKRVDSTGMYLNNTSIKPTREQSDWYELSVKLKMGYKFSIAMENAAYKGYTSEKIVSSLRAHTVPIYWGDPAVAEFINPKAFINISDYSSLEEAIERVKEIDNNDELWLDMVTQPWQTEEQRVKTLQVVEEYSSFIRHIFSQDLRKAKRVPNGYWGNISKTYFSGYMAPLLVRSLSKVRPFIAKFMSRRLKDSLKKTLHFK